jgi:hypothetical protein
MAPPNESSRPQKLSHAQTILYEIDMLNFAAGHLKQETGPSSWCYLECFLLHFRNLIEFFGKEPDPKRPDDLSIFRPRQIWTDPNTLPSEEALRGLHQTPLWRAAKHMISKYLQHCTEERVNRKIWYVHDMFVELSPIIDEFEALLPDNETKTCDWERVPKIYETEVVMLHGSCAPPTPARVHVRFLAESEGPQS